MANFLYGSELNAGIERIIKNAAVELILISPFIKLHEHFAYALKSRKYDHRLKITIIFGKNDDDMSKSLQKSDFDFFREFPNIEIRYQRRLHAKYYANENESVLTSMNLYNYSQENNIEAGIIFYADSFGKAIKDIIINHDSLSFQAKLWADELIKNSDLYYQCVPQYEEKFIGKKYIGPKINKDILSEVFTEKIDGEIKPVRSKIQQESIIIKQHTVRHTGFCIRTGIPIPFDIENPFCEKARKEWEKHKNKNYKEKYCHFSGEESFGETSYAKPVLNKYWQKAKEKFDIKIY